VTLTEASLAAFAVLNGGRALAYIPQIMRVARDRHGAAAISVTTWSLFAAANVATVFYATVRAKDWVMAAVFGFNAVACVAIVAVTLYKRFRYRGAPHGTSAATVRSVEQQDASTRFRRIFRPSDQAATGQPLRRSAGSARR
jgi:hypothetical protein